MSGADDPGAARQGNFINYYQFNPPANRLELIPKDLLAKLDIDEEGKTKPLLCLDVGCNTGELTSGLFAHLKDQTADGLAIHGVDVDPVLIQRATEMNQHPEVTFDRLDLIDDGAEGELKKFLSDRGKTEFDASFCFGVTMWVHLNHGDDGLMKLIKLLASLSLNVILEPQPWKCYRSAARRMRKLGQPEFEHLKHLSCQSQEDLERFIKEACVNSGLELVLELGTTKWDRKLLLLRRQKR